MSALDDLYAKFPAVPCPESCDACCSPVPFSEEEMARVIALGDLRVSMSEEEAATISFERDSLGDYWPQRVTWDDPDGNSTEPGQGVPVKCCAFRSKGRCAVYEARPFICRAYGCSTAFPCVERGVRPESPLSDEEMATVTLSYHDLVHPGTRKDVTVQQVIESFKRGVEDVRREAETTGREFHDPEDVK